MAVPKMRATATTVIAINRAMRTDEAVCFLYACILFEKLSQNWGEKTRYDATRIKWDILTGGSEVTE